MKTKNFKYYAINGLIFFLLVGSGWLYIDYKDYTKWFRWQQMTESAEYRPIKVKLLNIVVIEETSAVASYNSNMSKVQSIKHSQGRLVDKKGKRYKVWISEVKRPGLKIGNTYNLFDLDGVNIIPDFVEKRPPEYEVSYAGKGGLLIISIAFFLYFVAVYYGLRSKPQPR